MSPARRPVGSGIDVWHTHRLRAFSYPLRKKTDVWTRQPNAYCSDPAFPDQHPALADDFSGADTAWMLTSTALVLFMTIPGLSLFYAGLVRVKNVLSVLMQCFALTALMSVLWFVMGYTLAFGSSGSNRAHGSAIWGICFSQK